jgi:hypothetical protein
MASRRNHVGIIGSVSNGYYLAGISTGGFTASNLQVNGTSRWAASGALTQFTSVAKGSFWAGTATNTLSSIAPSVDGSVLTSSSYTSATDGHLNWMVPGGWVLLSRATWSSSTVDFTSAINSTYNNYCFILENIKPASSSSTIGMQTSVDGSTWVTTGYQYGLSGTKNVSGVFSSYNAFSASDSNINLLGANLDTTTSYETEAQVNLINPSGSGYPTFNWQANGFVLNAGQHNYYACAGSGVNPVAGAIVGVRFICSGGVSLTTGNIIMYGQTKPS